MAYNAWVTSSKTALKDLKKEKKNLKKQEKKRAKRELQKQQGERQCHLSLVSKTNEIIKTGISLILGIERTDSSEEELEESVREEAEEERGKKNTAK